MALGIGYGLPFVAQHGTNPYKTQWAAALEGAKGAGATVEDENAGTGSCLVARGQDVYTDGLPSTPSLLIVPQFYKAGNLYQDVPPFVAEDSTMRFAVSRNTTATRVNSSGLIESVASGVPRIDWLGQSCPALLVEASGQNVARWVNQMTAQDTPAASGGMTITTGSTDFLAPDGTSGSITKYVGGAASGTSQNAYYSGGQIVATASGAHTFSLFVKRGATNPLDFCAISFSLFTGASGTAISYFNLASGTAITAGASIQDYGNGWYRLISAPYTIASGDLSGQVLFNMAATSGSLSFAASGALNLTAYTWGAQFETGSVATTYIPTTTAAVSRAADVISASGALVSGLIGQTEGTIYAEVDVRNFASSAARRIVNMRVDGNNLLSLEINSAGTSIEFVATSGGVAVTTTASGLTSGIQKIAVGYNSAASGTALYVNGTLRDTKTIAIPSLASVVFGLGVRADGGAGTQLNDRLRAAAIYTTRLSNDQLANITRLT
jgi:hypothetical protein